MSNPQQTASEEPDLMISTGTILRAIFHKLNKEEKNLIKQKAGLRFVVILL